MFWSGFDPMLVRLPEHAEYVASRMIRFDDRRRNLPAETWALQHLPVQILEGLLNAQAPDRGPVKTRIETHIRRRNSVSLRPGHNAQMFLM